MRLNATLTALINDNKEAALPLSSGLGDLRADFLMNTIPLFTALSSQGQRRTLVLCLSLSLCVLCSGCQLTTSSAEQVQAQNITTQRHNDFLAEVYADMANHLGTYFPLGYTQFEVMLPEASNTPEHPDDQPNGQLIVQPLQPEQALARALAHKGAAVCQSLRTCNFKAQPLTTTITSGDDYTLVEVFAPELTLQRIYNERAWPLGPISIYGTRPSLRASAPSVTTNTARPAPNKIVAKATAPATRRPAVSAQSRSVQIKHAPAAAKIVAKANAKAPTPTPTTTSSVTIGSNQAARTVVAPSPAPQKPVAAKVAVTNPVVPNTAPQSKSQAPALSIPAAATSTTTSGKTNKAQSQSEQVLPSEPALPSKAQSPAPKAPTAPKVEIKGPLQFAHEGSAPAPATAQVSTPKVATPEATPVTASQVTPVTPQKTTSAETKTLVSQTKPQQQPKESGSTPANNPALTALISHNLTERYSFAPSLKEPLFISPTQADRYTQRSNLALQNLPWQWGQRLIAWAFGSQTKL